MNVTKAFVLGIAAIELSVLWLKRKSRKNTQGSIRVYGPPEKRAAKITQRTAVNLANAVIPGKALSALLMNAGGYLVYEVIIRDALNGLRAVLVDAGTGRILGQE